MDPDVYQEMARTEDRHWWFRGRRAILLSVIDQLGLSPGSMILEAGAGTGGNLAMLSDFGRVCAVEMDATARAFATEKYQGRFDIRTGSFPAEIPFADERFDLICFLDVLEHIDVDVDSLSAAKRLLRDGGRILVTVPAHAWLWSAHDARHHHVRRYNAAELSAKARNAGLEIVQLSYFNTILFPLAIVARYIFGQSPRFGTAIPPEPVNRLFYWLFSAERLLLRAVRLPFGLSLLAVLAAPSRG